MNCITIEIEVSKASAIQSAYIKTPLPVFAAVMFTHALDKQMHRYHDVSLDVSGVGLIHRSATPWIEYMEKKDPKKGTTSLVAQPAQQRASNLFGGKHEPTKVPGQPNLLTDLSWSLLLECEHIDKSLIDTIRSQVMNMRFAGGAIISANVRLHDDAQTALGAIRRGFWVDDATCLIKNHPNPAFGLLAATREHAWTLPVTLGYSMLENPVRERQDARDGLPHCYAQHLTGLVQLKSVRSMHKAGTPKLWRHGWIGRDFLVTNDPETKLAKAITLNSQNGGDAQ